MKATRHAIGTYIDKSETAAYASGRKDEREQWLPVLEALKAFVAPFDGDHIDEIEDEYGLATAQRVDNARAAIKRVEP